MDSWVVEALRVGYRIPFDRPPLLSDPPLSLPAYSPHSIRGVALNQELQDLLRAIAVASNIAYVCVIGQSERVESMKWFLLARTNKEFLTSLPII